MPIKKLKNIYMHSLKISHIKFSLLFVFIVSLLISAPLFAQSQTLPPNVVLIMTDDMGWGDLSSYGSPDLLTPNIDSIANEGIRLTDFYANGVMCSPTRAGLMTGRYQQRYNILGPLGSQSPGLIVTENSLPQLLSDAGYQTALIGKWHLGNIPEESPNAHGFNYVFGFMAGYIDYYQHDRGAMQKDLWENNEPIEVEGYMTDLITERSVEYIEANADNPFFIEVAYNAPHWPYQVPDQPSVAINNAGHLQPFSDNTNTREDYLAMLERVDEGVGQILTTLDRLQLADNTLVIFTNDNGGEWLARNEPFFNRKLTVWEGGIRVPTMVRWPDHIPAGLVSEQVGITMDLTPTILAATGARIPSNMEGLDLMPIWTEQAPEIERTLFWRTNTFRQDQSAVRSGDWKMVTDGASTFIFNLETDPGERNDLANSRQDIANRLRSLFEAWSEDVDAEAAQRGFTN